SAKRFAVYIVEKKRGKTSLIYSYCEHDRNVSLVSKKKEKSNWLNKLKLNGFNKENYCLQ
ncbi:hypothetical protein ABN128_32175, partial [Klebsiella variicola subsp. variicola]